MADATKTPAPAAPAPAPAPQQDYVQEIIKLKNQVNSMYTQEQMDAAAAEKKKLLEALVSGKQVDVGPKETEAQIREVFMSKPNEREGFKASLALRKLAIERGERDPYESRNEDGKQVVDGEAYAKYYQSCLDRTTTNEEFVAMLSSGLAPDSPGVVKAVQAARELQAKLRG